MATTTERTLSIIKPDATRRNLTGAIVDRLEKAGLRVVAQKRVHLSRAQAESFYEVHAQRPFFGSLVEFMTSGPVVVQVLEGEGAVAKNREVMGATDPAKAAPARSARTSPRASRRTRPRLDSAENAANGDRVLLRRDRDRRLAAPAARPRDSPRRRNSPPRGALLQSRGHVNFWIGSR
jgi:nucleoside-diphosphate kinase